MDSVKDLNKHEGSVAADAVMENKDRTPVTVIGLGPMGQALAGALLKSGHPTTIWNRSVGKADALVKQGAVPANTVAEAVATSPLVIICVLDYNVVQAILEPARGALRGRTLVNLTAGSPVRSRKMFAWAAEQEIDYIDGAILTPTPTIGTPAAVILYNGPELVYKAAQPVLASLGGTASYLGASPGRAAAFDVALLDYFWTCMSGYSKKWIPQVVRISKTIINRPDSNYRTKIQSPIVAPHKIPRWIFEAALGGQYKA